ncbi:MAG: DUF1566 domain-containing protein [Nitrospinales bacterium]
MSTNDPNEKDPERLEKEPAPSLDDVDESLETEEWIGEEWGDEPEDEETVVEPEIPTFVDNGDGTISDTRHKLMWAKADSFHEFGYGINWFEANDYCESLNEKSFAGFDDWRLPGFEESKMLFSFDQSNRDKDGAEIHINPFFEPGGGHNTWTYEEKPDYTQYAMKFSYVTGNEIWENKDNEYSHVRPVRNDTKEDYEPAWRQGTRKFEG